MFIFTFFSEEANAITYPLSCGSYEISAMTELTPQLVRQNQFKITVAANTLSATDLILNVPASIMEKARGKFWVRARIRLTHQNNPYRFQGTLIGPPQLMSLKDALPNQAFILQKEKAKCEN